MNKLAQYLNQHLIGEVIVDQSVLEKLSVDNSALSITPEMAAYPRNTNDIRKLLRFSWQLAEKGHKLPVTPRGAGSDTTGGAIGSGIIVATSAHMDRIFEFDLKQRLVRLQPGVTIAAIQDSLGLQGMSVPELSTVNRQATIGGVISSRRSDADGDGWIDQLEVVLANGDLLQTKRQSKRELNKKKGEQSFEADIYRGVDGLIEENKELVDSLDDLSVAGYAALRDVKRKDGSLDLTPLFFAGQGTLGVISEMIIKAEVAAQSQAVVVAAFTDETKARDAIDGVEKIGVTTLMYYDQAMLQNAQKSGKNFGLGKDTDDTPRTLLVAYHNGTSRALAKKTKKLTKHFSQFDAVVVTSDKIDESDLASLTNLATLAFQAESRVEAAVPVADGIYVTLGRFEQFNEGMKELAKKYHTELPLYGRPLDGIWYVRPTLNLKTVSGKQAIFKLTDEIAQLAHKFGGHLNGEFSEGRTQSYSVQKMLEPEVAKLYTDLKAIFDPNNILNSGVKQSVELRDLAAALRSDYATNASDGLTRF